MDKKAKTKDLIGRIIKVAILPVFVYVLFLILSRGTFGTARSIDNLIKGCLYSTALSWGFMILWTSGMMDMSGAATMLLGIVIGGNVAKILNLGEIGMIVCIIAFCIGLSTLAGTIVTKLKLPAMAASFGIMMAYEALTQVLFNAQGFGTNYYTLALPPYCYIALIIAAVVIVILLNFTKIGRHMRAMGKSPELTKSMGISIDRTKILTYTIAGVFIGIAAVMFITRSGKLSAVTEMMSFMYAMNAIMGVVIGMFLSVYCDKILATFIGTIVMNMLSMGLLSIGIPALQQSIYQSIFLLAFMIYSTNQYRVMQYFHNRKRGKEVQAKISKSAAN